MPPPWVVHAVGWGSSSVLLATLVHQIVKEQRAPKGSGVSNWLFLGQSIASVGFIAYSWMVDNWVFIVTNSLILATSAVGYVLHRRRGN